MKAPKNLLKLVYYPDPKLRISCSQIDLNREDWHPVKKMSDLMLRTMYFFEGIGLSAPQVGFSYQMFVMDTRNGSKYTVINPKIINYRKEIKIKESCLSFPRVESLVPRFGEIDVSFYDEHKNEVTMTFSGLDAVCFQHEFEHLHGKLFIDKLNGVKKEVVMRKLKKQGRID